MHCTGRHAQIRTQHAQNTQNLMRTQTCTHKALVRKLLVTKLLIVLDIIILSLRLALITLILCLQETEFEKGQGFISDHDATMQAKSW